MKHCQSMRNFPIGVISPSATMFIKFTLLRKGKKSSAERNGFCKLATGNKVNFLSFETLAFPFLIEHRPPRNLSAAIYKSTSSDREDKDQTAQNVQSDLCSSPSAT